jgi:hypothetical protein
MAQCHPVKNPITIEFIGIGSLSACIIPWWFTAFLFLSLPSMQLDAQRNASVFILHELTPG